MLIHFLVSISLISNSLTPSMVIEAFEGKTADINTSAFLLQQVISVLTASSPGESI